MQSDRQNEFERKRMNFNEILHGDGNMEVISWLQGAESKKEENRRKGKKSGTEVQVR